MLKVNEIIKLLECTCFTPEQLDEKKEVEYAFSADLMSDTLYILNSVDDNSKLEKTVLVTGLATNQAIKSAEILDVEIVIIVRAKNPSQAVIDQANQAGILLLGSKKTMFESNGILYTNGIKGINS